MEEEFKPLKVVGSCVLGDAVLYDNMDAAIARGYPEVLKQEPAHEGMIALVASGPSVAKRLGQIREFRAAGIPIVAIRGAHDFLIENGIIPDYALNIDPLESAALVFKNPRPETQYMIGSQSHPVIYEYLKGMKVTLFHLHIAKDQKVPAYRMLIGGGTTSGLRAISLFYVLGWRHMALFGYDSCMDGARLRVNGDGVKPGDTISPVRVGEDGGTFWCNPAMALQAQHFQDFYDRVPDLQFYPFGEGLIPAIIAQREKNGLQLQGLIDSNHVPNDRVSFIHCADKTVASWRYRADIPARELGASLGDLLADTLIFAKPQPGELMAMSRCKARGGRVIVDFCDDHFDWPFYAEALRLAEVVTCPTETMAARIKELGRDAIVIPDPWEYPLAEPHCAGTNVLWFGHGVNKSSLERVLKDIWNMPELRDQAVRVVSNFDGAIPWSYETMLTEFASADIVILPATDAYKSANRAVEAIRQGCFVIAEPHPALSEIPGIWIGDIKKGIEWTRSNPELANLRTLEAQQYVTEKYSPQTCAAMWRTLIPLRTTSEVEERIGVVG